MKTTSPLRAIVLIAAGIVSVASCSPTDVGHFGDGPAAPRAPDAGPIAVVPPGSGGCVLGSTMGDIESKLFQGTKCVICHGKMSLFPTSLDLASPNLAGRVVDRQGEANPLKGKCAGKVMVPRDNPTGGLFVEKVVQPMPSCGDRMPQGMPALSNDEIACVKAWVTMAAQAAAR
jgi:hypothetical protein